MVSNIREQIRDFKIEGSPVELVEFSVLKNTSQARIRVWLLNFRKANFYLFKDMSVGSPERLPSGTREWIGAGRYLRIPSTKCKSSQFPGPRNWARKARDRNRELQVRLKGKKQMHKQRTGGLGRAKSWCMVLYLAKNSRKGFYRYVNQKKNVKEGVPSWWMILANW